MVVTCDIEFDQNPAGTYFAGQLVSGFVNVKCDKAKEVKAVLLKLSGYAVTSWTEKSGLKKIVYNGHEEYIAMQTYLVGSEETSDPKQRLTLPIGVHQYTFACQLPYNCPTSFEGVYGHIRYVVKVVLIRPWKYDQTYTRGITVLKPVDLNYESPQLKLPAHTSNYRTFGCGPCTTEPLKMELSLPQSGYVPGQNIAVNALIINNTNIAISAVEFTLVMLVRYYNNSNNNNSHEQREHSRVERIAVVKIKGDSVLRNCTRSLTADLHVPATPPSCLSACKLIQIAYQIEVEAITKSFYDNQLISIPVTIGNIPIWSSVITQQPSLNRNRPGRSLEQVVVDVSDEIAIIEQQEQLNEEITNSHQNLNPILRSNPTTLYPDLPPPSYKESVHTVRGNINEDELYAFGRNEFAPLYPVYQLPIMTEELLNSIAENGGHINESYIG